MFGTFYDRPERPNKSPTVFNLGYTDEVAKSERARIAPGNPEPCGAWFTLRYPWVAELSGGVATGHPRQRAQAEK